MLLDLTELSSYLPLVSSFEFGNASGKLFPCTEGRVRTIMVPPGTPRAGAFGCTRPHVTQSPATARPGGALRVAERQESKGPHKGGPHIGEVLKREADRRECVASVAGGKGPQ